MVKSIKIFIQSTLSSRLVSIANDQQNSQDNGMVKLFFQRET